MNQTKQAIIGTVGKKQESVYGVELEGSAKGRGATSYSQSTRAGLWIRVSNDEQDSSNQLPDLERFCERHGFEVAERYVVSGSAWKDDDNGEYRKALKRCQDDAWAGKFDVVVVWALDRLTRGGAESALRLIRQFRERRCTVLSVRESWLNGAPEVQDVLVAFAAWMAQQESTRRSERIKAGMARRAAEGKPIGRAAGSKDVKPRRRSGYLLRWERARAS